MSFRSTASPSPEQKPPSVPDLALTGLCLLPHLQARMPPFLTPAALLLPSSCTVPSSKHLPQGCGTPGTLSPSGCRRHPPLLSSTLLPWQGTPALALLPPCHGSSDRKRGDKPEALCHLPSSCSTEGSPCAKHSRKAVTAVMAGFHQVGGGQIINRSTENQDRWRPGEGACSGVGRG